MEYFMIETPPEHYGSAFHGVIDPLLLEDHDDLFDEIDMLAGLDFDLLAQVPVATSLISCSVI
jgi:hypothetical protein